jgi:hypothetical protein
MFCASETAIAGIMSASGTYNGYVDLASGFGITFTGALPTYPQRVSDGGGDAFHHPTPPFDEYGQIAYSQTFTAPAASLPDVILVPVSPVSPNNPLSNNNEYLYESVAVTGTLSANGGFTAHYTLDATGLPATFLSPFTYQVLLMGSANLSTFDISFSYDDNFGHLGDRELHFAPQAGTVGTFNVSGVDGLLLPALPPGDLLTVTGSFKITENINGGSASAIEVVGTPEPRSLLLFLVGVALFYAVRTRPNWGR